MSNAFGGRRMPADVRHRYSDIVEEGVRHASQIRIPLANDLPVGVA